MLFASWCAWVFAGRPGGAAGFSCLLAVRGRLPGVVPGFGPAEVLLHFVGVGGRRVRYGVDRLGGGCRFGRCLALLFVAGFARDRVWQFDVVPGHF